MASITELQDIRDQLTGLIESRGQQLDILSHALENLLSVGASDYVVDQVMTLIEYVDAGEIAADTAETITEPAETPVDETETPIDTRKQIIAELRSQGYVAPGFDALVRLYHRDLAEQEWQRAENDCRGQLVRAAYRANYDPRNLWFCNDRELRKYASEELLEWFDQHGRLTYQALRNRLLDGKHYVAGYYNMR